MYFLWYDSKKQKKGHHWFRITLKGSYLSLSAKNKKKTSGIKSLMLEWHKFPESWFWFVRSLWVELISNWPEPSVLSSVCTHDEDDKAVERSRSKYRNETTKETATLIQHNIDTIYVSPWKWNKIKDIKDHTWVMYKT